MKNTARKIVQRPELQASISGTIFHKGNKGNRLTMALGGEKIKTCYLFYHLDRRL